MPDDGKRIFWKIILCFTIGALSVSTSAESMQTHTHTEMKEVAALTSVWTQPKGFNTGLVEDVHTVALNYSDWCHKSLCNKWKKESLREKFEPSLLSHPHTPVCTVWSGCECRIRKVTEIVGRSPPSNPTSEYCGAWDFHPFAVLTSSSDGAYWGRVCPTPGCGCWLL